MVWQIILQKHFCKIYSRYQAYQGQGILYKIIAISCSFRLQKLGEVKTYKRAMKRKRIPWEEDITGILSFKDQN